MDGRFPKRNDKNAANDGNLNHEAYWIPDPKPHPDYETYVQMFLGCNDLPSIDLPNGFAPNGLACFFDCEHPVCERFLVGIVEDC